MWSGLTETQWSAQGYEHMLDAPQQPHSYAIHTRMRARTRAHTHTHTHTHRNTNTHAETHTQNPQGVSVKIREIRKKGGRRKKHHGQ